MRAFRPHSGSSPPHPCKMDQRSQRPTPIFRSSDRCPHPGLVIHVCRRVDTAYLLGDGLALVAQDDDDDECDIRCEEAGRRSPETGRTSCDRRRSSCDVHDHLPSRTAASLAAPTARRARDEARVQGPSFGAPCFAASIGKGSRQFSASSFDETSVQALAVLVDGAPLGIVGAADGRTEHLRRRRRTRTRDPHLGLLVQHRPSSQPLGDVPPDELEAAFSAAQQTAPSGAAPQPPELTTDPGRLGPMLWSGSMPYDLGVGGFDLL